MAALAGHARHAMPDLAVEHNAGADARAEGEHAHRVGITTCAHPLFAECRYVGIVLKNHLAIESPLNFIAHRIVGPVRQIGRLQYRAARHIDDPRHADSRTGKLAAAIELFAQ